MLVTCPHCKRDDYPRPPSDGGPWYWTQCGHCRNGYEVNHAGKTRFDVPPQSMAAAACKKVFRTENESGGHIALHFSSGAILRPHASIIGLSHRLDVSTGYDSNVTLPDSDESPWTDPEITHTDCVELADYMLARWQKFKEKHAALVAPEPANNFATIRDAYNVQRPVTLIGGDVHGWIVEIRWEEIEGRPFMQCAVRWASSPESKWHDAKDLAVAGRKL